jgi:hypothetical protein
VLRQRLSFQRKMSYRPPHEQADHDFCTRRSRHRLRTSPWQHFLALDGVRPLPRRGAVAARLDLALSPDDRQARPVDEAFGRSQPPARGARPCHQARYAGRCDFHRRRGQPSLTCAAASIRATPTLVSRASATRPISATRRIWRWTRRAASCVRLR